MKNLILLFLSISLSSAVFSQPPAGMTANAKAQPPSIGHLYGKIVDSLGKPVSDASVLLLQSRFDAVSKKTKEVLFKGLTTKSGGEFSFEELPVMGKMKLKNICHRL